MCDASRSISCTITCAILCNCSDPLLCKGSVVSCLAASVNVNSASSVSLACMWPCCFFKYRNIYTNRTRTARAYFINVWTKSADSVLAIGTATLILEMRHLPCQSASVWRRSTVYVCILLVHLHIICTDTYRYEHHR